MSETRTNVASRIRRVKVFIYKQMEETAVADAARGQKEVAAAGKIAVVGHVELFL